MGRLCLWAVLGVLTLAGCRSPEGALRPVMWHHTPPPISEKDDHFTVRILELDDHGSAKDEGQLQALHEAARKADDIFVFVHGWRRDAHDVETMRAFLRIYRGAFDCLSRRDEEGTQSCDAIHGYCHPRNPDSKLVVLVLWDAYSGPFGFRQIQARAGAIGNQGFHVLLTRLHGELDGRGTLLVVGHSLGGAMAASALMRCAETGEMPVDGAMLLVGAFDAEQFKGLLAAEPASVPHLFLLNLFNPHDGYLKMYRWIMGHPAAGEAGITGVASIRGDGWAGEGRTCGSSTVTTFGASLWDGASLRRSVAGSELWMLNLNMDGLVRSHVDIEDPGALRMYNRATSELMFQVLWARAFTREPGTKGARTSLP